MKSVTESKLQDYLRQFQIKDGEYIMKPITNSHINDTFRVEDGKGEPRYILQRINHEVFKEPAQVMDNIVMITEYMQEKMNSQDDAARQVMRVVYTREGSSYLKTEDGYWRMYDFIPNAYSCDRITCPEDFRQVAAAIGRFHKLLGDYDGSKLYDTIPNFHNTPNRYEGFCKTVKEDRMQRATDVQEEIGFILEREGLARAFEGLEDLKLRVTHNDTKPSNIMLDKTTGKGLCMIDLDTVMPGTICDDFGDAIRSGACRVRENDAEVNTDKYFDEELYEVFHEAFLQECGTMLTETERKMLPIGAMKITYEQALRFLEDYINGDTYYKVTYPEQNLRRARIQMQLLSEMEQYFQSDWRN